MLALISPSKTQDFTPIPGKFEAPALIKETEQLVSIAKKLSPEKLGGLMDISEKLANLNYERYQNFEFPFTAKNAKPAVLAFRGDVYDGLDADSLSAKDLEFSQTSLRILSGLYGLLKPLDLIQPYRLEMGIALKNPRGKDLYAFWGDRITQLLNQQLKEEKTDTVINLASVEYFSAIQPKKLEGRIINIHFKERKAGQLKVVALFAKRARGMMAGHIIRNRIKSPKGLMNFTEGGYGFEPELSTDSEFVFARNQPKQ